MGQVTESTQSTKDCISRQVAIDKINERQRKLIYCFGFENDVVKMMDIAKSIIAAIPSAQPYTDEEIQTMQDLEQAQFDKAYEVGYELGWKEGREARREEIWEDGRDRLDQQTGGN